MANHDDVYELNDMDYFPMTNVTRIWYKRKRDKSMRCIEVPGMPNKEEIEKEMYFNECSESHLSNYKA